VVVLSLHPVATAASEPLSNRSLMDVAARELLWRAQLGTKGCLMGRVVYVISTQHWITGQGTRGGAETTFITYAMMLPVTAFSRYQFV
jgi:hypothetical protein